MRSTALALVALLALAGATGLEAGAAPKKKRAAVVKKSRATAFRSCAALARYGRRHVSRGEGSGPSPPVGLPGPPVRVFGGPESGAGAPEQGAGPVAEDNSTTNVQEEGVDEPDAVKSRGTLIFAVGGEQLHAIDVSGAAPKLLGSLPLQGHGHELLIRGERALVFSRDFGPRPLPGPGPTPELAPIAADDATLMTEVDLHDPAAMRIVKSEELPGRFVSARLTGRTARVVVAARPPGIAEPGLRDEVAGWMPRRELVDAASGRRTSRRLAPCRNVRRPVKFSGLDLLTVLTVDLAKGLPAIDSDAIESGGEIVYASPRALYVATQQWIPEPSSTRREAPRAFTAVHQFDASDPGETAYRSSGRVPGYLLNQFAMSERRGVLRVASTEDPAWWAGAEDDDGQSFVTTLDRSGPALVQLGQVSGLGRGERIYAVRFIDDAGFVVTFRQVDPLFAIDLTTPRAPRLLGELKIPGYSAYLHPLQNDRILGVGQDATEQGGLRGAQLSLFDISDLRAPKRLHKLDLGLGSSSEVEFDHHAFLHWPPARLAVLPVQGQAFTGAIGLRVTSAAGIVEVGRASHDPAPIRRSLVVGGKLFTLSDDALAQNSLQTLVEEARLALPPRP